MTQSLTKNLETNTSKVSSAIKTKIEPGPGRDSSLPRPSGLSAEFKAGALVALALVVFLGFIFAASSIQLFARSNEMPVLFNYVSGLEVNSPVYYGGLKVGKVKKLSLTKSGQESKVLVMLSISPDVRLRENSEVFIDVLGFMGEKFIELTPGTAASPELGPGRMLTGTDPVSLMKIVKDGRDLMDEFNGIADSLTVLVGKTNGIVGENQDNLNEIFSNLNASSKNLKEMTADLKKNPWKLLRKSEKKKRFLVF